MAGSIAATLGGGEHGPPRARFRSRTAMVDLRNIRTGLTIPDEGYCDQPYVVVTNDGHWLCTFTTGPGREGDRGQHVVATISKDRGRTWSPRVDIEPSTGPAASWAMPLVAPTGRVYVFYDYNGDRVSTLGAKKNIRADTLGWYVYKFSDDHGKTWSAKRYRLPVRHTQYDRINDWHGAVQMFWGIGKPIVAGRDVFLGFSKIAQYGIGKTEGWFFRSGNILSEPDPDRIAWEMLPVGDIGLRAPAGSIAEEHNLVALKDGQLYAVYRTVTGYIGHAYSRDRGRTWTPPAYATYRPHGNRIKNPRACARLWQPEPGKYLLWYHNHSGKGYFGRNPAWLTGGVAVDGHLCWSQPEILLYDPDCGDRRDGNRHAVRMSYPDLIHQDGHYWVTETQKSIARVHEIDGALLVGLWNQRHNRTVATKGLVLNLPERGRMPARTRAPVLGNLAAGRGFALDLWVTFQDLAPGQVLVDARDGRGKGWSLVTTRDGTIGITLSDGQHRAKWDCDRRLLQAGRRHHVAVIVDGGPKIVSFVVDGVLCDGGRQRQYGWGQFTAALGDVNGANELRIAPSLHGRVITLRVYDRYLRTSEAVGNARAGPVGS